MVRRISTEINVDKDANHLYQSLSIFDAGTKKRWALVKIVKHSQKKAFRKRHVKPGRKIRKQLDDMLSDLVHFDGQELYGKVHRYLSYVETLTIICDNASKKSQKSIDNA